MSVGGPIPKVEAVGGKAAGKDLCGGRSVMGVVTAIVAGGDVRGEAYTAIVWGGLLSRESAKIAEAEAVDTAEGDMCGAGIARRRRSPVVEDPITHDNEHTGT